MLGHGWDLAGQVHPVERDPRANGATEPRPETAPAGPGPERRPFFAGDAALRYPDVMADPTDDSLPEPPGAGRDVDPWRFAGRFIANALGAAIPAEPGHDPIPWTPVARPLAESRVALLSTAGISMRGDPPFDMDYERRHPTRGDSSWRRLRADATADDVQVDHLHIDTGYIERDLAVALPLRHLHALADEGRIGSVAPSHYSVMGFQGNDPSQLVERSAPEIAAAMRSEEVDLVLLAPV